MKNILDKIWRNKVYEYLVSIAPMKNRSSQIADAIGWKKDKVNKYLNRLHKHYHVGHEGLYWWAYPREVYFKNLLKENEYLLKENSELKRRLKSVVQSYLGEIHKLE